MFHSATLKLTGWYLSILILISLSFSMVIYTVASREVGSRLSFEPSDPQILRIYNHAQLDELRQSQVEESRHTLFAALAVANIVLWAAGGFVSYHLARRTLRPIEEAHEAQSRFTSDASHELRTPLASMKTELEVALRDPELTEKDMRELLESNLEEVNKLSSLSYNLLQLSRLEHNKIAHEPVDLEVALGAVVNRFSANHRRFALPQSEAPLLVMANQANVEELLTILIDNALKYSAPTSKVSIEFARDRLTSGFTVTNSGPGIPAEKLPFIFDRFYQVESSRTSGDKKGYGLGLSLAKKLVEIHGGSLTASSQPGAKTTFEVMLPNVSRASDKEQ